MANTSKAILTQLGITTQSDQEWNSLYTYDTMSTGYTVIEKGEPIFMRLDLEEEVQYIRDAMKQ